MRRLVRAIDHQLRRRQRIEAFWDHPDCVFRIRVCRSPRPLQAPGLTLPAGAPVVELHYWNERLPRIPPSGPTLSWGTEARRRLLGSFAMLAHRMTESPELRDAVAVTAVAAFWASDARTWQRLLRRLGFFLEPYGDPSGRWGSFWEKAYARLLLWTFNPSSLRGRALARLEQVSMWMPADAFVSRYRRADGRAGTLPRSAAEA